MSFWAMLMPVLLVTVLIRADAQSRAPEVLVLVQPSRSATLLSLTFAGRASHARVRNQLRSLAAAGRWDLTGMNIRDVDPRTGEPARAGAVAQTEATAWLLGAPVYANGAFWLQPFVATFSEYGRVDLLFMVPPDTAFRGLRQYATEGFRLELTQLGGPYRYSIEAAGASPPQLPLHEPEVKATSGEELPSTPRRVNPYALVLLVASLAALTTFLLLLALGRARMQRIQRRGGQEHGDGV